MEDRQQLSRRLELLLACCAASAISALAFGAWAETAPEGGQAAAEPAGGEAARVGATPPAAAAPDVDYARIHLEAAEGFYASDGDRDGFVSAQEAMEMPPDRFAAADRDRDGKLTLVEWVDARFEGVGPAAPRPPP